MDIRRRLPYAQKVGSKRKHRERVYKQCMSFLWGAAAASIEKPGLSQKKVPANHKGSPGHGLELQNRCRCQREPQGKRKSRVLNATCVQAQPGRGDRTRTCGLVVPNHARYQLRNTSKKAFPEKSPNSTVSIIPEKEGGCQPIIRCRFWPGRLHWFLDTWRTNPDPSRTWS